MSPPLPRLALALGALASLARCAPDTRCATTAPQCTAAVSAACTGALTPLNLPAAQAPSGCLFDAGPRVSSDASAQGFPVGETLVQQSFGSGPPCATRVTVTDPEPPALTCANLRAVRAVPGASLALPLPAATDRCGAARVTAEPASSAARGPVSARYTATDASGNTARCEGTALLLEAPAPAHLRVAHAALGQDGRTSLTLVWDRGPETDATHFRVESAPAPSGPWSAAATVGASSPRYEEPGMQGTQRYYRVVALVEGAEGGTTEPLRALALSSTSYDLGVQPVPGLDVPAVASAGTPQTSSAPLRAVVRYPTELAAGPFPLVLLLHGNHGNCRLASYDYSGNNPNRDDTCVTTNDGRCPPGSAPSPNAQGLAYLAETLASHGYVVASVDANALNCRELRTPTGSDGLISQRGYLLLEHLRRWRTWSTDAGAAPFAGLFRGRLELSRVGLFGHSRGAEAVASVRGLAARSTDLAGLTLGSVFSLAPTNFDDPQPGGVPFATLVPACDGDVATYNGVQLYDRTRRLTAGRAPTAQLFLARADHDYFNTEWRFDDNWTGLPSCEPTEVGEPAIQQRALELFVPAWFDGTLPQGAALEPWLRAAGDLPPSLDVYIADGAPADLRRSYSSAEHLLVDDFEDADPLTNLLGGSWSFTGGFEPSMPVLCTGGAAPFCDRRFAVTASGQTLRLEWPHQNAADAPVRAALALDWRSPDATAIATLSPTGSADLSGYTAVAVRVASRYSALNAPDRPPHDFELRLVDAAGHRASARASEVASIPHLYLSMYSRAVLQTVRFALAGLAQRSTPPLDLAHLARLELALSVPEVAPGSLLLSDVEFQR